MATRSEEVWRELREATGLTLLSPEANDTLYEFLREHVRRFDDLGTDGWTLEAREDYLAEVGTVLDGVRAKQEARLNEAIKKQSQDLCAVGATFSRLVTDLANETNALEDVIEEFDNPELDLDEHQRSLVLIQDECTALFNRFFEARDTLLEQVTACAEALSTEISKCDGALADIETNNDVRQIVEAK